MCTANAVRGLSYEIFLHENLSYESFLTRKFPDLQYIHFLVDGTPRWCWSHDLVTRTYVSCNRSIVQECVFEMFGWGFQAIFIFISRNIHNYCNFQLAIAWKIVMIRLLLAKLSLNNCPSLGWKLPPTPTGWKPWYSTFSLYVAALIILIRHSTYI